MQRCVNLTRLAAARFNKSCDIVNRDPLYTTVTKSRSNHDPLYTSIKSRSTSSSTSSGNCSFGRQEHYRLVVVGGGAGGSAVTHMFTRELGQKNVAVIEPSEMHYYQPMWTLVGAGAKRFDQSVKRTADVLSGCTWIKDECVEFSPDNDAIGLASGKKIKYDYLIIALGLQLRFDLIKGLPEAFDTPGVCSNYHKVYVNRTLESIQKFRQGNCLFTFPSTPIKCPGAPQKIMYLTEENFRKTGKRAKANIMYFTPSTFMFAVKKYNEALLKICQRRDIVCNFRHALTEIRSTTKEAVFQVTNEENKVVETKIIPYEMIHVGAPCSSPEVLRNHKKLTDANGYLDVDKFTLEHVRYPNIFGIGDCTNLPTSKTAAAVAVESGVLAKNLRCVMKNQKLDAHYDGYASCPLITGYSKAIMPEFDYTMQPVETLPLNQAVESRILYHLKADLMPDIYWLGLLKGYWTGPKLIRKILHLGMEK